MAEGIEVRHSRSCGSRNGKRCNCAPGYRVAAYDAISKSRVSKTFKTLGEARAWRATAHTQAAKGIRLAGTPTTLRDAAEPFLAGIASGAIRTRTGDEYKPAVVREYERSLRLHVLPILGSVRLSRIQRRDVQALVDGMLAGGADPSTIRNALKPLRVIYRLAIEDGDLALSPCERLRLPAVRGRRERIASPDEAAALVDALRPEDRALWGSAFSAGLRRGELRALVWEDVDLAAGVIRVERSMSGAGEIGAPKSRAGRRKAPIIATLRDLLVEHKLVTRREHGFVFGTGIASPFTPNVARGRALTAWRRASLAPIGPPRMPPHLREPPHRGGREREGDLRLPRPRFDPDDLRPLRPFDAGQRGRGHGAGRRLHRARDCGPPARATGSVSESDTVSPMSESLRVTIVYEQGDDGWIVASVPEVPGTHSQGKTREEARANVIDALRGMLELRFGEHAPAATAVDSEPLELVIGA